MKKLIGYIGLGKMGFNMSQLLLKKGWEVHAYNRSYQKALELEKFGAKAYETTSELVKSLESPRLIWIMVPHKAVDSVLESILDDLQEGDIVVDGGNSPYTETLKRAKLLAEKNIKFIDAGISGGPDGALNGACTMVGTDKELYQEYSELFKDISAKDAYGYVGPHGAGHYVKMVHNGIEYGMMQAIAEGFSIMNAADFNLDLTEIARIYNKRSVVESRLVQWLYEAFKDYGDDLSVITNKAIGTGEGEWTIKEAKNLDIPAHVIDEAFKARKFSELNPNYQAQIIMAMRNKFGGHKAIKE